MIRSDRRPRGRSARTPCRAARRDSRAVVLDGEHDLAVDRSTDASTAVPGSVWRSAFSSRFSASRWSSSRAPEIVAPAGAATVMAWPSETGSSSPAASVTTRATSTGSWRVIRPASARASSSRSATSRRIRRDERNADAAASRCSPVEHLFEQLQVRQHRGQRRPQLVRRVRDELALTRQGRLRLRRAPVQRVEHPVQRPRQLGDLVLAPRDAESGARGRGCARSSARSRSARRSGSSRAGRSRRRRAAPARCRRARRAPRKKRRGWRSPRRRTGAARTGRTRGPDRSTLTGRDSTR